MIVVPVQAAEPDFTTSSATFEPVPAISGSLVRYTVVVSNTGGDSSYTRITIALPPGYLIATSDDCAAATPSGGRLLWYEGRFAAGARQECRVTLLPRPDAAGTIATLATEIATPPSGYFRLEARPTLVAPPNPDTVYLGPLGITPAGVATLGLLTLAAVGAAALAMKTRPDRAGMRLSIGAWIAIVTSIGFLVYFASLARNDLRSHTEFQETSCVIVDSSIRAFKSSGKNSGSTYAPEFAVRYDARGVETYSVASPPATSVSVGWIGSSQQALERLAVGSTQPCWFDPNDVKIVLLDRGPGGAYFFALLPLLVLALGSWMLAGALRSRSSSRPGT
ncbi:MAG: hypothetical protein AB7F22_37640 [Reyranella sp.]|uniref:DUF3592 domain-containing protein n=1 Tax=Reyranella sp. TaxID=1929291 RepID=UPI003D098676